MGLFFEVQNIQLIHLRKNNKGLLIGIESFSHICELCKPGTLTSWLGYISLTTTHVLQDISAAGFTHWLAPFHQTSWSLLMSENKAGIANEVAYTCAKHVP